MTIETGVAIVGALIANAVAFAAVLMRVGALGERMELMWSWYLAEHGIDSRSSTRLITPREFRRVAAARATKAAAAEPIDRSDT